MIRYISILVLVVQSYGQVTVKLLDTALLVNEGQQFQIRIQKTGLITSVINTVVSVSMKKYQENNSQSNLSLLFIG